MKTLQRRIHPVISALLLCASLAAAAQSPAPVPATWGSYEKLFSAQSPWNSRPVNPVLDPSITIPTDIYEPAVAAGAYSAAVFRALPTDGPVTVYGPTATTHVSDPDSGTSRNVTVPRFPAGVIAATGADGHAEIVDAEAGVVHSFWKLKQTGGVWRAALYSWSPLNGNGFGDPAHHYQGARATGVPSSAGIIRKQELTDGKPSYNHALAISLAASGLTDGTSAPAYVYPATSTDSSTSNNTGGIPEGSLLMLPANFDDKAIAHPELKRIVATLKSHGAYVVDRTTGTPFVIYVENGANFNLMPKGRDNNVVTQLRLIRAGLRKVTSAERWVDGDGNVKADPEVGNILSMRGAWSLQAGPSLGVFDTLQQAIVFPNTIKEITQANTNNTGLTKVHWALPAADTPMRFTSVAAGAASVRLQLKVSGTIVYDSNFITDGQSTTFIWPSGSVGAILIARSGVGNASTVKGLLNAE
jgi:hypothetical protein